MPSTTDDNSAASGAAAAATATIAAATATATATNTTNSSATNTVIAPMTVYPFNPSVPDTNAADAAASDEGSLSTDALLEGITHGNEDDASVTPGEVELSANDDSIVAPNERTKHFIFLAKTIGIHVEHDLKDVMSRPGNKKLVKFTKAMLYSEIKRRNPSAKVNKNNTQVQDMWTILPALTDERDINYIRARYASIREGLFAAVRAEEVEESVARRQGTDVMRVFLLILKHADLRRAYMLSQDPSNREMLDAGETHMSNFLKLLVRYFNDPSKTVSTPCQASLHSSFSEAILCNKGDFELTEEKAKKIIADARRHLTTMINDWEKSGNGSNQQRLEDDDEEQDIDMDLWGRFDADAALEAAIEKGDDTNDGDDRANFLKHLPQYWLMVWHLCDEGDLLRFTCAQLRKEHGASSDSTPSDVSRAGGKTSARKLAQQTYDLQKQIAASVRDIGRAVSAFSSTQDKTFERASKIRRLDMLKGDRYLTFKDSKNPLSVEEERAAAAEFVKELDERIAKIEKELEDDA